MTALPSPFASANFSGLSSGRRPPPPLPGVLAPPSTLLQVGLGDRRRISSSSSRPAAAASSVSVVVHNSSPSGSSPSDGRRSGGHASKACDSSSASFHGVHVPSFLRPQEGRGLAPYNQLEKAQQKVHGSAVVSHGNSLGCGFSSSPGGLGGDSGSQGRLFSREHPQAFSSLSPLRLEGGNLRIPSFALRNMHRSLHIHQADEAAGCFSPLPRHPNDILFGRRASDRVDGGGVQEEPEIRPLHSPVGRILNPPEEIQSHPQPTLSVSGVDVGHVDMSDIIGRDQVSLFGVSSDEDAQQDVDVLPLSSSFPRPCDGLDHGGSLDSSSLPLPSSGSVVSLQNVRRFSQDCSSDGGVHSGSPVDLFSPPRRLRSPDVAASPGGLRGGSDDGCVGLRMGNLLRWPPPPGVLVPSIDGCCCPSPYQCEGNHGVEDLPPTLPPILSSHSSSFMENGQHHGNGLHSTGGRDSVSGSPKGCEGNFASGSKPFPENSPCISSIGGESPSGCCVSVPTAPGLASPSNSFHVAGQPMGSTGSRSLCDGGVCSTSCVFCVGQGRRCRSVRRPGSTVGISTGVRVSSPSVASEDDRENSPVVRLGPLHPHHASLACSEVGSSSSRSPRRRRLSSSIVDGCGDGSADQQPASDVRPPASRRLAAFRRLRAGGVSDSSFDLLSASWRSSTSGRYDKVWASFERFLQLRRLELDSVDIGVVIDYLSSLFSANLAYRTIILHRSVLSSTLPSIEGFPIGRHPLVSRLMRGVFLRRPPSRRVFQEWNVGDVLDVFRSWDSPIPHRHLQRKCAFMLAMASSRRPSELASLRFSDSFMTLNDDFVRFIPSRLSKTDRQNYLGHPIIIRRLPTDVSMCPVAALEDFLVVRRSLTDSHDYVFCDFRPPHSKISTPAFARRLTWCLRKAGITAPPGSTRATSVSEAFRRGIAIPEILRAGDWSGASTFFRHYLRPRPSSLPQNDDQGGAGSED